MSLYLAVFDEHDEIDGVEVGHYEDAEVFVNAVSHHLEPDGPGTRFPTLVNKLQCDGEWSPADASRLIEELETIETEFRKIPAAMPREGWQRDVLLKFNIKVENLYQCFIDVDGEPLVERILGLARMSVRRNLPVLFQ